MVHTICQVLGGAQFDKVLGDAHSLTVSKVVHTVRRSIEKVHTVRQVLGGAHSATKY